MGLNPTTGVEDEYHLFLAPGDTKHLCFRCGKETNFKLFDGYFRQIDWCCSECYEEKYGSKRKKV